VNDLTNTASERACNVLGCHLVIHSAWEHIAGKATLLGSPHRAETGQEAGAATGQPASFSAALRRSARQQLPITGGAEIKKLPEEVREWIRPAPTSLDQVAGTPSQSREDC
jgi:hypothetical protein